MTIYNYTFNTDLEGWAAGSAGTLTWESTIGHDGLGCAKLVMTQPSLPNLISIGEMTKAAPVTVYAGDAMSIWLKSTGAFKVFVGQGISGAYDNYTGSNTWQKFTYTFLSSDLPVTNMIINILHASTIYTAYIDDIRFVPSGDRMTYSLKFSSGGLPGWVKI